MPGINLGKCVIVSCNHEAITHDDNGQNFCGKCSWDYIKKLVERAEEYKRNKDASRDNKE